MTELRICGLAPWSTDLPDVLDCQGGWALMAAPEDLSAEARLRRQVGWCRAAVEFLPLSPRAAPTRAEAGRLVATRGPLLDQSYRRLRGRSQALVQIDLPRPEAIPPSLPAGSEGRHWLKSRAAFAAGEIAANAAFDALLQRVMATNFPSEGRVAGLAPGGTADRLRLRRAVLLPRAGLQAFAATLALQIDRESLGGLWDVIAPLPPLAFAALEPDLPGAVA